MKFFAFDTRDKKPKLYHLLILSAIASASAAALILRDPVGNAGNVCAVVAAYGFSAVLLLLYSFREQIRYNPYSYNTIIYFGFALFALSVAVTYTVLSVRVFRFSGAFATREILHALLGSAKNYILLSAPFLFVFSSALCVSNVILIRHEGARPVNLLGIVLSLLIVTGAALLFCFASYAAGSKTQVMLRDLLTNLFAAVYLYFECMLIGTMVASAIAARHEPKKNKDFLIVLGCGLKRDGTPTPILQRRLERALAFYERQKAETGKTLTFVTSGGQGADESVSESAAMKRWLLERGIPEAQIVEEDRSSNTFENMKFSKEKILTLRPNAVIAFSTNDYHVFRSGLFARRVKMRAVGMGAKTAWYYRPNAAVREFVGLLTKHRGKQALILAGTIAFYVALTLLEYR